MILLCLKTNCILDYQLYHKTFVKRFIKENIWIFKVVGCGTTDMYKKITKTNIN